MTDPERSEPIPWLLHNEFAAIQVRLNETGNSPRLQVTDLRTGQSSYLDALVLERICWATRQCIELLVAPPSDDA